MAVTITVKYYWRVEMEDPISGIKAKHFKFVLTYSVIRIQRLNADRNHIYIYVQWLAL